MTARIPRHRTSVVCCRDGRLLMIEIEDPVTRKRMWSLPGGAIEADEMPSEAAVRETLEETGYAVQLVADPVESDYLFRWNAKLYDCHCHWFAAVLASDDDPATVDDASYLLSHRWLPVAQVPMLLAYHPPIARTTLDLIAILDTDRV